MHAVSPAIGEQSLRPSTLVNGIHYSPEEHTALHK
jgi:hypothetical protein